MRFGLLAIALFALSGCLGTPQLPRLADVELAENAPQSGIVAANSQSSESALQELEGVDVVPEGAVVPEKPRRGGLFGLFGRKSGAKTDDVLGRDDAGNADGALGKAIDAQVNDLAEAEQGVGQMGPEGQISADEKTQATPAGKPRGKGLFGLFGRKAANNNADQELAELDGTIQTEQESHEAEVELAALATTTDAPRAKRGLFGPRRSKSTVEAGVQLPFGEVGIACGIRGNALGKEVDRFPQKGKGYRLYDTNPSSTSPRTFFVTGLKDRCPRQFTAAMAMLDTPVLHEQMRYDRYNKSIPMTKTDKVYEGLKQRICKAGRGKPCPESRIEALEKTTAYVSAYPRLGTNANWFEILLNKGKVAASSKRSR